MGAQTECGSDADDVFAGAGSDGRRAWRRRPLRVAGGRWISGAQVAGLRGKQEMRQDGWSPAGWDGGGRAEGGPA